MRKLYSALFLLCFAFTTNAFSIHHAHHFTQEQHDQPEAHSASHPADLFPCETCALTKTAPYALPAEQAAHQKNPSFRLEKVAAHSQIAQRQCARPQPRAPPHTA